MEDASGEWSAEEHRVGALVHIGEQLQCIRVFSSLTQDGAGLEDDLVGAKVITLEEDQLVFVRQVQWTLGVFH